MHSKTSTGCLSQDLDDLNPCPEGDLTPFSFATNLGLHPGTLLCCTGPQGTISRGHGYSLWAISNGCHWVAGFSLRVRGRTGAPGT
ncbi:hypothetical protein I7I48_12234 [Histoplasma ohiense]|nr:hypothetical protein I7I48_12234 [Histoplasma ohiense (nom. inval.)]